MHQDSPITRPCSTTQPWIDNPPQEDPAKPSRHSCIPTLQHPTTPSHCLTTHHPANSCPPSTSHIPTPHCNPFPRTIDCSSIPFSRPRNHSASPIARPSVPTPANTYQFLMHLTAINGNSVVQQKEDDLILESRHNSPASCNSSESSNLPVTPRSPPAPIQMLIVTLIPHKMMTHDLHQVRHQHNPQPATEHLDHEFP